jgi:uncharacterized OB-fold protein
MFFFVPGFKCSRCGHTWAPRGGPEPPTVCPKCKNPNWNKPPKKKLETTQEAANVGRAKRESAPQKGIQYEKEIES